MLNNACCPTPKKDGSTCRAQPTKSGYCLAHSPDLAERRQQARLKGGFGKSKAARAQKLMPQDLLDMDQVIHGVIAGVYKGSLSPAQGSAIASLMGARVRLREIALKLAEQAELREREFPGWRKCLMTLSARISRMEQAVGYGDGDDTRQCPYGTGFNKVKRPDGTVTLFGPCPECRKERPALVELESRINKLASRSDIIFGGETTA